MKIVRAFLALALPVFATTLSGCTPEHEVASPACVELDKTTDPARREELKKMCPRDVGEFKPSKPAKW